MTKQHDGVFDAVLSGVAPSGERIEERGRPGARFLKRGNAISNRLSGQNEEKVLHWVDPKHCRMWDRHNRDYGLLTEENCRDLIEGIRVQGRQEFPAIVRRVNDEGAEYEVICGARRHFAVSWLRANNYPQFKYLVEVRDLSDEEAFRLSDIENRDREDISDYERARDYAQAVKLYYGGKQKAMATRLEVSEVWLSRYLDLAKLPQDIIDAYPSIRDIRELHARTLKPVLKAPKSREKVLEVAKRIAEQQKAARKGEGSFLDSATVVSQLKSAVAEPRRRKADVEEYRGPNDAALSCSRHGRKLRLEFDAKLSRPELEGALDAFLKARY